MQTVYVKLYIFFLVLEAFYLELFSVKIDCNLGRKKENLKVKLCNIQSLFLTYFCVRSKTKLKTYSEEKM
uniref:Putative secreted protein n=1 Tax=Psorophora albipes TaxID=869069 RepID=T1D5Y5_9DIPT